MIGRLPRDGSLAVYGTRMADERFSDGWRRVRLEVGEGTVAGTEAIGTVFVDEERLMFDADAEALDEWRHDEPLDGKADDVFWGRDWGNGAFDVLADFGRDDEVLRLRVDLGSNETVERLRASP